MLQQLTGIDASFLYMETGGSFGHVSGLAIYERPDDPSFSPYEAFRRQIRSRLPLLPPFRRRLVEVPFGLAHPYWVNDPEFDLDYHVRYVAVPPPGDMAQLCELTARIIGRPLDRCHPLWEFWVIDGLPDGRFAVLSKMHHATIDGAAGAEMLTMLLDDRPDAPLPAVDDPWRPDTIPSDTELLARTMGQAAIRPGRALRLQVRVLRELGRATRNENFDTLADALRTGLPGPLGGLARRVLGGRTTEVDELPPRPRGQAPRTSFNRTITRHRVLAIRTTALSDVKEVKNAVGGTVNDVVMAVCAGALRRYLEKRGELPDQPLVAMVPVSIRTGQETDKWTNRVSAIFTSIPTNAAEPLERLAATHRWMQAAKQQHDLVPADMLIEVSTLAPPALSIRAMRLAARMRLADRVNPPVNLVISNVPGPRTPLYLGGARLLEYHPVSTIVDGQGLNITVQSYLDQLHFGLVGCRELVPDIEELADLCVDELDRLRAQAATVAAATVAGEPIVAATTVAGDPTVAATTVAGDPTVAATTLDPTVVATTVAGNPVVA
jgi:WS/DGAT/MGAT family acyltransferase